MKRFLVVLMIIPAAAFAQQDFMFESTKAILVQMQNMKPSAADENCVKTAAAFSAEAPDSAQTAVLFSKIPASIEWGYPQSGYSEISGKRYETNYFDLKYVYARFPDCTNTTIRIDVTNVADAAKKNILLNRKVYEKYRSLGIIDQRRYATPCETEGEVWLSREVGSGEKLTISGEIFCSYPAGYERAQFDSSEKRKMKALGDLRFTLLNIDGNIVTYEFEGDRQLLDRVKIAYLDGENRAYTGFNSIGINAAIFHESQKGGLSDEKLSHLVSGIDILNMKVKMVYRVSLCGSVSKVIFYTMPQFKETKLPFSVDYSVP